MNKEKEIELVYQIIIHPAAFDLDIAGILCVRRYEHPQWAVEWESYYNPHSEPKSETEVREFDDPKEAAKFFVEKRHELEIGLDFDQKAMEGYYR